MVSLMDLVKMDLVRALCGTATCVIFPYSLVLACVLVPVIVADTLLYALRFFQQCFLLYLTAGVIVQFLYIHSGSASLFETVADETIQVGIRVAVGASSLAINTWWIMLGATEGDLHTLLTTGDVAENPYGEYRDKINDRGVYLLAALVIIGCAINIVLRTAIYFHKRRAKKALGGGAKQQHGNSSSNNNNSSSKSLPLYMLLSVACFAVIAVILVSTAGDSGLGLRVRTSVGVFCTSVLLPASFFLPDRRIREFARKWAISKLAIIGGFPAASAHVGNQVAPA